MLRDDLQSNSFFYYSTFILIEKHVIKSSIYDKRKYITWFTCSVEIKISQPIKDFLVQLKR